MSDRRGLSNVGLYVYAFGSFAAGVFDMLWGNFDADHQPLQAWGDNIPGATIFAYITGVGMVAGAVALLWRRSERVGGAGLGAIYFRDLLAAAVLYGAALSGASDSCVYRGI
jgi:hypothetical protein